MNDDAKPPGPVDEAEAAADEFERIPWHEGPDEDAAEDSWLALDDDGLLHRIETLGSEEDEDDQLLEVVASHRHFFVRQEAAKRVHDRRRLFAYEDDRHVGQILVRHLTRREDLTYLERLAIRSRHVEVRSAAQVQLARVWRKIEAPRTKPSMPAIRLPLPVEGRAGRTPPAGQPAASREPVRPTTSAAVEPGGVDASLLGWAAHFIVESAWGHLGTTATRELLRRTQARPAAPARPARAVRRRRGRARLQRGRARRPHPARGRAGRGRVDDGVPAGRRRGRTGRAGDQPARVHRPDGGRAARGRLLRGLRRRGRGPGLASQAPLGGVRPPPVHSGTSCAPSPTRSSTRETVWSTISSTDLGRW